MFGEVTLGEIGKIFEDYPIEVYLYGKYMRYFSNNGQYYNEYANTECLLFPSKEQRDWSKFKPTKVDLPINTPVMIQCGNEFVLRYYAGNGEVFRMGLQSYNNADTYPYDVIIPFDKFNPNNIEESLKYKL